MKKLISRITIILITIALIFAGFEAYKHFFNNSEILADNNEIEAKENENEEVPEEIIEEKKVQIYSGDERPIAVMLDNSKASWPQAGLNDAYLVYEIIVEGGETRLMALFKGANLDKIGSLRSARHYFLDYALENDAIYVHFGWSPQAQSDISKLDVENINGLQQSSKHFWREKDKKQPHNAVTNTESIWTIAEKYGYRTTSDAESLLKYSVDEINLTDGIIANSITIPHSKLQTVEYVYDEENMNYVRYARNKEQTDWDTGDSVTTKNIIVMFIDNYTLKDTEDKGRQGLHNIGTFDGYYITNGQAIEIKCTKESRESKTVYKDLNGNEIIVNDGNTFINICHTNTDVTFE